MLTTGAISARRAARRPAGPATRGQQRTHNAPSEIDTDDDYPNAPGNAIAATTGPDWIDPTHDAGGRRSAVPY